MKSATSDMMQIPDAAVQAALEALKKAEMFIENGVEYGFIRLPEKDDPALDTLPKIKAAIATLTSALPHLPLGFEVKKLVAEERRNKMWDCGRGYMIGWNNEDYYRVRFHGNIILRKIKGLHKAVEWVNKHHSDLILSAIDTPATLTDEDTKPVDVAAVRKAAELACMYLANDFIECDRCGHEVETKNTDAEYTLRKALSAEPAQGDQWQAITHLQLNGDEYLTWNGRRQHVARFDKVENSWVSSFTTVTRRLPISPQPTHFSPLPAAPTPEAEA